jgi:hypothetical protein
LESTLRLLGSKIYLPSVHAAYAESGLDSASAPVLDAAAELVEAGVPAAEAAAVLAGRFAISVRQARRYVDQAVAGGRVPVPEASDVHRQAACGAGRVRAYRRARLEGCTTPRASRTVDRPREEWIEIAVPAIVTAETFERAARRLEDNKRGVPCLRSAAGRVGHARPRVIRGEGGDCWRRARR